MKYVAAVDCGTAINPKLAEGQTEGAVMNGICYALTEEMPLRRQGPHAATRASATTRSSAPRDLPELVTILVPDLRADRALRRQERLGDRHQRPAARPLQRHLRRRRRPPLPGALHARAHPGGARCQPGVVGGASAAATPSVSQRGNREGIGSARHVGHRPGREGQARRLAR